MACTVRENVKRNMSLVVNYIVDVYVYESERFCVLKNMNDLYMCPLYV